MLKRQQQAHRRIKQPRRNERLCAYCGGPAISKDHVPPACIFSGDRKNLITVPACKRHNGEKSQLDTLLLQFLGIALGGGDPLWEAALKSFRRTKRDRILVDRSFHVKDSDKTVIPMEAAPFLTAMKLMTRALYWHETRVCLGLDTPVSANIISLKGDTPLLESLTTPSVANSQFVYAFGVAADDEKSSMWYMQFHGRLTVSSFTGSVADA